MQQQNYRRKVVVHCCGKCDIFCCFLFTSRKVFRSRSLGFRVQIPLVAVLKANKVIFHETIHKDDFSAAKLMIWFSKTDGMLHETTSTKFVFLRCKLWKLIQKLATAKIAKKIVRAHMRRLKSSLWIIPCNVTYRACGVLLGGTKWRLQ